MVDFRMTMSTLQPHRLLVLFRLIYSPDGASVVVQLFQRCNIFERQVWHLNYRQT